MCGGFFLDGLPDVHVRGSVAGESAGCIMSDESNLELVCNLEMYVRKSCMVPPNELWGKTKNQPTGTVPVKNGVRFETPCMKRKE